MTPNERKATPETPKWLGFALLTVGVTALALAGYTGYVLYPRFGLSAVEGAGLFLLAGAAGIASFFSPCSFSLLVTLLARHTGMSNGSPEAESSLKKAVPFAGALAIGASLFFLLSGVLLALGGQALFANVTFTSPAGRIIRTIVGLVLIVLGAIQLELVPFSFDISSIVRPLMKTQAQKRRQRPVLSFGILGFAYPLAGFG